MSTHRSIYVLAVLAILVAVAQCESIVLGSRQPGDCLLASDIVFKGAVGRERQRRIATYSIATGKKITAVELYDRNGNKDASHVEILYGGPGKPYISIGFYSDPGYAVEYEVKVYEI